MKRKQTSEVRGHRSKAELAARRQLESGNGGPGIPPKRQGMDANWRKHWRKWAACLNQRRVLLTTDGPALDKLVDMAVLDDTDGMAAHAATVWGNRKPYDDTPAAPTEPAATLPAFIESVAAERASFRNRMRPGAAVCLDIGDKTYDWPAGDAGTVARQYALEVTQDKIVAGELVRRACDRFLKDLETAHDRGLFFDPLAVRYVVQFAERYCGLKLMSWQAFLLANIYGWKRATGYRRFTEALVSVAKKNGKTALGAVVGLWGLVCDCEKYADVFCAATKKEQSKLVWRDARRMVTDNEELREYVQRWSGQLTVQATDSNMTPLSSDTKSMDGTRGSTFICDEVHMWGDRDQFDKLTKGGVSRTQPISFLITTAGETKNCFCWNKFDFGEKVLRGVYVADETFVLVYGIDKTDDWKNESCWVKANPSLGVTLKIEHLRQTKNETDADPSGLNAFLRYHLNIWPEVTLQREGSIAPAKWAACRGRDVFAGKPLEAAAKFLELNKEARCFGGLDVGLVSDLSCFVLLFPEALVQPEPEAIAKAEAEKKQPEPGVVAKRVAIAQFFMPEEGLLVKEKAWGVPLSVWARDGWIELLPGDMTDTRLLKQHVLEVITYGPGKVHEIGFDDWNARVLAAEINEERGGAVMVAVPQTAKELTSPAKEFLRCVYAGELCHFDNPVLSWMAGNVILQEDPKHGGIKPDKPSKNEKIDGIAALLNAWHRMLAAPPPSVYNTRGIQFI